MLVFSILFLIARPHTHTKFQIILNFLVKNEETIGDKLAIAKNMVLLSLLLRTTGHWCPDPSANLVQGR